MMKVNDTLNAQSNVQIPSTKVTNNAALNNLFAGPVRNAKTVGECAKKLSGFKQMVQSFAMRLESSPPIAPAARLFAPTGMRNG